MPMRPQYRVNKYGKRVRKLRPETVTITKKVAVPKMKDTTKAGVLAVVRRMIAKNMENKFIGFQPEPNVYHNSAISAADCEPIVGQIVPIDSAVGNTSQQRMGDRIKPKSLTVHGVLSLKPDEMNTTQVIYARVVIAAQKNIKVGSAVLGGGVDAIRLLRPGYPGVGTDQTQFTGTTMNLNEPLNRDLFKVYYDKIHKLSGQLVTGGAREQMPLSTQRWKYTFKDLPSAFTFDEGNGNWANNFAPFVAVGYAFCDGSPPDVVTTRVVSNVASFLSFEDA